MSKRKPDENENLVSKRTSHEPVSDDEDDMNDWLNFAKDVQTINNDDDDDAVLLVVARYTLSAYLSKINVYLLL